MNPELKLMIFNLPLRWKSLSPLISSINNSSTVESTMASEVEDLLGEVDRVMGRMVINPADDVVDMFFRHGNVEDGALVCITCHIQWESDYENKMDATLKQKVVGKISMMRAGIEAYQLDVREVQTYQEQEAKCS